MGSLVHVQELQGVYVLDPAGTLSKQRLAVPDHVEAERDALAQGVGEGPERSDEQHPIDHVSRPDVQHPKARRLAGRSRYVDGARPDNQYAPLTEARCHHAEPHAMQARYDTGTNATMAVRSRLGFLPPAILHHARYEVS